MEVLEERVTRLEDILGQFIQEVGNEFKRVYRLHLKLEKEFIDFKDEMKVFKDEMLAFKDEMKDFKDEVKQFMKGVDDFKVEINRKMGELSNRLGTLAEDIVAPGIPYAINKTYGLEAIEVSVRRRKRIAGKEREYDVICVAGDYVFVIDVKGKYRSTYLSEFELILNDFFFYFPEYKEFKLIPCIASLNFIDEVVNIASKMKWLAIQLGGEYLEIVNAEVLKIS